MAIKLFTRKPKDVFVRLDKLMMEIASEEIYLQYLKERESLLYKNYYRKVM